MVKTRNAHYTTPPTKIVKKPVKQRKTKKVIPLPTSPSPPPQMPVTPPVASAPRNDMDTNLRRRFFTQSLKAAEEQHEQEPVNYPVYPPPHIQPSRTPLPPLQLSESPSGLIGSLLNSVQSYFIRPKSPTPATQTEAVPEAESTPTRPEAAQAHSTETEGPQEMSSPPKKQTKAPSTAPRASSTAHMSSPGRTPSVPATAGRQRSSVKDRRAQREARNMQPPQPYAWEREPPKPRQPNADKRHEMLTIAQRRQDALKRQREVEEELRLIDEEEKRMQQAGGKRKRSVEDDEDKDTDEHQVTHETTTKKTKRVKIDDLKVIPPRRNGGAGWEVPDWSSDEEMDVDEEVSLLSPPIPDNAFVAHQQQQMAVEKKRAEILKYTPKTASRLQTMSRMSTPSTASQTTPTPLQFTPTPFQSTPTPFQSASTSTPKKSTSTPQKSTITPQKPAVQQGSALFAFPSAISIVPAEQHARFDEMINAEGFGRRCEMAFAEGLKTGQSFLSVY